MYREERPHGKRKRERDRMDPLKSQAPERGSAAALKPGTGGEIGITGGTLLTQYILKNQVRLNSSRLIPQLWGMWQPREGCTLQKETFHENLCQDTRACRALWTASAKVGSAQSAGPMLAAAHAEQLLAVLVACWWQSAALEALAKKCTSL